MLLAVRALVKDKIMSIVDQLQQEAEDTASRLRFRMSGLDQELAQLEARKAQIEEERNSARAASQRLARFRPQIGADYQCPVCWVERETESSLRPIGGGTEQEDIFRCDACDQKFSFPSKP
jgi:DNA repair exonuclease SbcCD ATPase subunit